MAESPDRGARRLPGGKPKYSIFSFCVTHGAIIKIGNALGVRLNQRNLMTPLLLVAVVMV